MEDRLFKIFNNTNDWLKFAETKFASLLAGNGVLIFGILRLLKWQETPFLLKIYIIIVLVQLILSFIFCLVSFIPSLELPWLYKAQNPTDSDNLLFFMDISKYSPIHYLNKLTSSLKTTNHDHSDYEIMISKQIITNSVIASRKYKLFKISIWFTVSSIVTPFGAIVIYWSK